MSDPVGLFPGHFLGGIFGVTMIPFFTQASFAAASGNPTLPNGFLFGGGFLALKQLGIEELGVVVVIAVVFIMSFITILGISKLLGGITNSQYIQVHREEISSSEPLLTK
jgi:Amt family ammonium transporter